MGLAPSFSLFGLEFFEERAGFFLDRSLKVFRLPPSPLDACK
jgi:hypothetical protein